MSDRTRPAHDVRIVAASGHQAPPSPSSVSPSAVRLFRMLAAQAAGSLDTLAESGTSSSEDESSSDDEDGANDSPDAPPPLPVPPPSPEPAPAESSTDNALGPDNASDNDAHCPPSGERHRAAAAPRLVQAPNLQSSHEEALGLHIVRTCAMATRDEFVAQQLAERITRFCAMSGTAADAAWEVTLPMNPAVLPDTLLRMQLSPSAMDIRFVTSDTGARQLICDNADALRIRLADALGRRSIDIHVDVAE